MSNPKHSSTWNDSRDPSYKEEFHKKFYEIAVRVLKEVYRYKVREIVLERDIKRAWEKTLFSPLSYIQFYYDPSNVTNMVGHDPTNKTRANKWKALMKELES